VTVPPGVALLDTVAYIQAEARQLVARRQPLPADPEAIRRRNAAFRETLAELLGPPPLELAELQPEVVAREEPAEGVTVEKVYLASSAFWRVPALILRPTAPRGRRPAVVVVHGWGHTKLNMLPFRTALARAGYVSVTIDNPLAGEHQTRVEDTNEYQYASLPLATCIGWSPMGMGVWDLQRTVDYLQTRDDVDPERIGISGLCWGAMSGSR
jgi:cephalosporin-C deacetylase-like acetyl esterase